MQSPQLPAVTLPTERTCPFDPPAELDRLREEQPMARLAFPDGKVGWLMTRHRDVRAVLADDRFSSDRFAASSPIRKLAFRREDAVGTFITMDPPEHTAYRQMLTRYFTVRRMRELAPRIEQMVTEHLDAMEQAGPPVDLVRAFALPIPSLVICELLGVPPEDRADFQRWSSVILRIDVSQDEVTAAQDALRGYMRGLVTDKRKNPDGALLSQLCNTEAPLRLTDEELSGVGRLLLVAGHETTANMLGLGTYTLLSHPDQLGALREHPESIDRAVEELLRYLTIVHFSTIRIAREDVEIDGQTVRAGETVFASLTAANRDPEQFSRPGELDLSREFSQHVAFGHGIHQCLGQQLARVEMRIAFPALFDRFPTLRLAVPPEQIPMRDDMFIYGVYELPVTWEG